MERRSTILLVEDSPDDAFFFERAIREGGHDFDVRITRSGEEAIDYLQRASQGGQVPDYPVPRFIIMDNSTHRTPEADLLRWLGAHPVCRVVPTVILSGSDQPREVKFAFELGVHGYFLKPMSKADLMALLKTIFQYWAESKIPPANDYEFTVLGEQPVLKTER